MNIFLIISFLCEVRCPFDELKLLVSLFLNNNNKNHFILFSFSKKSLRDLFVISFSVLFEMIVCDLIEVRLLQLIRA